MNKIQHHEGNNGMSLQMMFDAVQLFAWIKVGLHIVSALPFSFPFPSESLKIINTKTMMMMMMMIQPHYVWKYQIRPLLQHHLIQKANPLLLVGACSLRILINPIINF